MTKTQTFTATIENAGGGGAFVRIPFDVEEVYGKKRVPVKASIDGQPYRGTLVRMGEPFHILIILKAIREKTGKDFGDEVEIMLAEDKEERKVSIPPDLKSALEKDPAAKTAFQKLSYSHQKEHVNAILDAKRPETRQRRILKTLSMLTEKKK
jgi:hypothetical protein